MLGKAAPGPDRTLSRSPEVNGMVGACSPSRTKKADGNAASIGEGANAPCGRTGSMPRQRIYHSRRTYAFPEDFPERLKRFQEESGLSWSEIARRIGTFRPTVWRWAEGRVRPNVKHIMALLELAKDLDLSHLFTE